jgi:hypothetical protein
MSWGGYRVEYPPSRPGGSLRRPALIRQESIAGLEMSEAGPAKEGHTMWIALLLLGGLLLWATGHMILR